MNGDPIFEHLSQRQSEAWYTVFPDLHRNVQFLLNTHPLLKLSEDEARQVAVDTLVEVVGRFSALPINSTENLKIFARRIALRRGIDMKRAQIMVNDPSNEEHKNTLERLDQFATYLDQTGDSEMGKFLFALGDCLEPYMNENSNKELVDFDLFHRSEFKDDNVRLKEISDEVTVKMKEHGFEIPLMKSHTWLSEFAFLTSVVEPFLPSIIPMSEAESEEILKQVEDRFPLNESKGELEDELPEADILESPKKSQRKSPVRIGLVLSAILILGYLIFSGDSVEEPYSVPGIQVEAMSKGGAIVLSINGEVNASETDGDERLNLRILKNRDLLIPGTQLETGEKCEVVLLMTNGSLVTLGEGARMKLPEFEQEEFEGTEDKISDLTDEPSESHVLIDLDLGELVVEVKKLKKESSFDLDFPLGFAGIRGTQYRILATDLSSRLSVLEGGVAVSKELGGQDDLIDSERAISLEEGLGNRLDEATIEELDRIRFVNGKARELAEDIKLNELADAFDQINERLALAKEQRELEKEMEKAVTEGSYLVESAVNLPMIWCESGSFLMGSTKGENGREPNETRHEVTLRNGFFLGKYELTQEEYMAVMGDNPSKFNGTKLPVESLNWDDAEKFCKKLTEQERQLKKIPNGWFYTLPSEADWEYACRAGTTTTYSWGNEINSTLANYSESEMNGTVNVGNYLPNPWGFHDMHGNVNEWVREKHLGYPLSKDAQSKAEEGELSWLYRGGPWHFSARYLRSAKRGIHPSNHSYYSVGMRLCLKKVPSLVFEKTAMSDQLDQGLETMEEKFDRLSKKEVGNGIHIVGSAANMEMIWCKPGNFLMGDENNSRNVTLTKGFFLGKYEVTQEEYQKVMGENPSKFKGNKNRPVEKVTWFKAMEFCKKLTESEHKSDRLPKDWGFTLPTEAEWEYACRAGTTTRYSWGSSIVPTLANYKASEIGGTIKVGNYKPNNWGIHDMHGNVGEWTKDWKAKYPKLNSTDPQGPESGTSRSVRGGFWFSDNLSTYGRGDVIPESRRGYVGFRLCLKPLVENKQASITDPINLNEGLVGWWKFDETGGKVAMDSSGKNRNGELKNFDSNTAQWVVGPVGNAINLDGIDDFIDVGDFEWGGELSFSAWIYYGSYQAWARVLDFGDGPKSNDIFVSDGFMAKGNRFIVSIKGSGGTNIPNLFKRRQWYHMAFTASSDRVLALFANGEKVGSDKLTRIPPKITRKLQYFGKSQHKQDSHLKGILDDLRIYDRAINESEIKSLFALGDSERIKIGLVEKKEISSDEHNNSLILEPTHQDYQLLEPVRIFKSAQGSLFEGRVLSYEGNNFFLEGKDAKILSVTLNQLSKEDQKYLQETVQAGKIGTGNSHENSSLPVEGKSWTVPSIGMEMMWCEPGTFMMGSPESEMGRREHDETQHEVTLTKGFYLGKYEVTQEEYEKVMGKNPSTFKGKKLPVEMVNWNDAMEFCKRLTELEKKDEWVSKGWNYTLPTEAQWEYACRAGTTTVYSWSDTISPEMGNYGSSGLKKTISVGSYRSNPWGLFDMHGNAWEWVLDMKAKYPKGAVTDPKGSVSGSLRVRRGGSWKTPGTHLRSGKRHFLPPQALSNNIGFRVGFQKSK